jgi:hypothetical protein
MNLWDPRPSRLTSARRRQFLLRLQQLEERTAPTGGFEPINGVGNGERTRSTAGPA